MMLIIGPIAAIRFKVISASIKIDLAELELEPPNRTVNSGFKVPVLDRVLTWNQNWNQNHFSNERTKTAGPKPSDLKVPVKK